MSATACTDVPGVRNNFPAQKAGQPGNEQASGGRAGEAGGAHTGHAKTCTPQRQGFT